VHDPEEVAQEFLQVVRLQGKRSWTPGHLSGGMRRRLAVALSMVGHPMLALLDEPTTGLDPVARREVWNAIIHARDAGSACILTTHMLEEAEELCTQIVILTEGLAAARGTVQQLKDTYSSGYRLSIDAKPQEEAKARQFMASLLPAELKEPIKTSLCGQLIFDVSKDARFVGNLFLSLATNAESNGIRHWGISQASLEDAYVRIVSEGKV